MQTAPPIDPDEGRAEYERAERAALRVVRDAEEDAATAEAIAAGFLKRIPTDAKPLADVGSEPGSDVPMVADGLIPEGQVILICGEEGSGKSWLAYQIAGELTSGQPVLGTFDVPHPARSILIVDAEQSEQDVQIIRDEMYRRGVLMPASQVYWLNAQGRELDSSEDIVWVLRQIAARQPELVIFDTATDSVSKPLEDVPVKRFMAFATWLVSNPTTSVRAVIGLTQPRKTGQSSDSKGRAFDSLFGSRVWKGRASAVFWLTERRLTVWKQRGNYLAKRWGKPAGARYPFGSLERPEVGPPTIAGPPQDEAEAKAARERSAAEQLEDRILAVAQEFPDKFSKDALARQVGGNKAAALAAIDRLMARERLGTNRVTGRDRLHEVPAGFLDLLT